MDVLKKVILEPLPLGSVLPLGWLKNQLQIQADGISGHLDEFWPDIQHSRWFGGDREGWERAPYWLDGLIPLAFVLDDPALKAKVFRYMEYILAHQHEDGWLGPKGMVQSGAHPEDMNYDLWGQMLATKVLVQMHEATQDARYLQAIEKALRKVDFHIDRAPLFNWGQFRWFETLIAIYYLYERTDEKWLMDLAIKLHAQGFDWGSFFTRWPLAQPTPKGRWNFMGHVVNNAMAPKGTGLWWRISGEARDREAVYNIIEKLDRYHGMATGVFSGDECIAGLSPVQGTELCAVVEYMFSLEILLSLFGDPAFGDRLERIAFNALPATFTPDMWGHQYDQQANQIECSVRPDRIWNTNGPESNIYGVEPNYGCCTSNLSQGWPKFAANLWMRTEDGGLAAVAYAPSQVRTRLTSADVKITLETEYPFRDTLHFTVQVDGEATFPLLLRIPAWAKQAVLLVGEEKAIHPTPGAFARIERLWQGETEVVLRLPMELEVHPRANHAISLSRGPLVYSLQIGEEWRRVHADEPYRELPHADWEVYPTTPWNYGLKITRDGVPVGIVFRDCDMGPQPFSPEGAPVYAEVCGQKLPDWQPVNGSANELPPNPVLSTEPVEVLRLIPYGCTNLRITEFPVLE